VAAMCQFPCYDDFVTLPEPAAELPPLAARKIEMRAIGFVSRTSQHENDRDRSLMAKVVLDEALAPALDGIENWSHIYVIFWMDSVGRREEPVLHHPNGLGILPARSPIHPNAIGLTLVELVKREGNVLWVRGLDAYDETPVLDIKPYPDWEQDLIVVTDFRVPEWQGESSNKMRAANQSLQPAPGLRPGFATLTYRR
jgi:tRNA-Thr(GGU) m(6)t(6)A37 methyltransferase TsaA